MIERVMNRRKSWVPFGGMVIVVMTQTSSMVVVKVAMTNGMNKYVMIVYYGTLSALLFLPCAFFLHRSGRPPLTLSVLCSFFALSLLGCGAKLSAYIGIDLALLFLQWPS